MIDGVVLCGGRSSRMGTDKSLLPVDGVPMARRVADALIAGGCGRVVAVGGDPEGLAAVGLEVVPDGWPGEGPLGGVLTALRAIGPDADAVVVVACDMPYLSGATVSALVTALQADHALLAAVGRTDRIEPLCAVWRLSATATLADALAAGERRLHAVLAGLPVAEVAVPGADVVNINAPGDLGSSV